MEIYVKSENWLLMGYGRAQRAKPDLTYNICFLIYRDPTESLEFRYKLVNFLNFEKE